MSRSTSIWIGIAAFAGAGVVVLGSLRHKDEPQTSPLPVVAQTEPSAARDDSSAPSEQREQNLAPVAAQAAAPEEEPVTAQTNDKTFRVNESARLVLDAQTRLNMEALFARTSREDLAEAKQQAVETLPAAAAAEAAELLDRYDNYQQAQRQAYPPGIAPSTEEAALAELDGLHALRVAHFGPVIARALYGEEEAVTRQLIELMRLEKDQSLTLEEKAARAQQLRDSLPELAKSEHRKREDPH
jgi:hypothetical protein